mmetsp:Transcript_7173/g.13746  ORF Transcript_7173/g.13746 Transcript_7173/m.13746 type:complete len:84 (-) Transcript_7173:675-926(-)
MTLRFYYTRSMPGDDASDSIIAKIKSQRKQGTSCKHQRRGNACSGSRAIFSNARLNSRGMGLRSRKAFRAKRLSYCSVPGTPP